MNSETPKPSPTEWHVLTFQEIMFAKTHAEAMLRNLYLTCGIQQIDTPRLEKFLADHQEELRNLLYIHRGATVAAWMMEHARKTGVIPGFTGDLSNLQPGKSESLQLSLEEQDRRERGGGATSFPPKPEGGSGDLIAKLVDRFLAWPLPESVCADQCATQAGYPHRTGTNLLSATEARQMFEQLLPMAIIPDKETVKAMKCLQELGAEPGEGQTPVDGLIEALKLVISQRDQLASAGQSAEAKPITADALNLSHLLLVTQRTPDTFPLRVVISEQTKLPVGTIKVEGGEVLIYPTGKRVPKHGDTDTCTQCGQPIQFFECDPTATAPGSRYWNHSTTSPRHVATPKGEWVAR